MDQTSTILVFLALVIIVRLFAGWMDGDRIKDHIAQQGGKLLERRWTPFGEGWYGSQNERLYWIRFMDGEGNIREATCKTSLFAGVYLARDRVVTPAPKSELIEEETLEEENQRLRKELARLQGNA